MKKVKDSLTLRVIAVMLALLVMTVSLASCLGIQNYPDPIVPGTDGDTDAAPESAEATDDLKDNTVSSEPSFENSAFFELIAEAYQNARDEGYTGDIAQYLKELMDVETDSVNTLHALSAGLLSSVAIIATYEVRQNSFFGVTTGNASSAGSGVIYKLDKESGSAYIITNYHVVHHDYSTNSTKISEDIDVYIYGSVVTGSEIPATFIGGSYNYDIAVLKIENSERLKSSDAVAISAADSNEITVGQTAIAIGNAKGMGISATSGVISVDSEYIDLNIVSNIATEHRVMRFDTAVNSGNSGGGLFNAKGELIGIVNAKTSDTSVDGIGYAIPSNVAIGVAQNIIDNYDGNSTSSLLKCLLGVTVQSSDHRAVLDSETGGVRLTETVSVASVTDGTLAEGKLQVNDVIKSITVAGKTREITRMFHVIDAMLWARDGQTVVVSIERDGVASDVTFEVEPSHMTVQD